MFYDIVNNLCKKRKTTITRMAEEIGLSNAAPTSWRKGSVPKLSTVQKISAYFDVSVEYLLGTETERKEENKKTPTPEGERDIENERILEAIEKTDPATREVVLRLLGIQ